MHHDAVAAHGEYLKINCAADGAAVTETALTALGSMVSKPKVEALLRLIVTDKLVVTQDGPALMLLRREIAPFASSPEPPPQLLGPHPARPLTGATPAEHTPAPPVPPVPPVVQSTTRRQRSLPIGTQPSEKPPKPRRVATSAGGAESPALLPLVRVSAAAAPKREEKNADAFPATSSRPTRQRHAPQVLDV